jgi:hypothetical protein
MRWEAPALVVRPDPFGGATVPIGVSARELPNRLYRDAADAAAAWREAPVVTVSGTMTGRGD